MDPRYLKVKDAEQDLHAKNQLNKSIHSGRTGNLIESCDLRVHVYFDRHAKITVVTFSFREFVSAWKKSVYSIYSFLGYSQFDHKESEHPIFDHAYLEKFQSTFNFRKFVSTC